MSIERFGSVTFIDGIPVVFTEQRQVSVLLSDDVMTRVEDPIERPEDDYHPDLTDLLIARLGDRVAFGPWEGEFPLQGSLLAMSLALHDLYLYPAAKAVGLPARKVT